MRRIVCVGSSFCREDGAGPAVLARLRSRGMPAGVELADGGVSGLGMLNLFDGAEKVVVVDSVRGFAADGEVVVLSAGEVAETARPGHAHAAGVAELLRVLPQVCEVRAPEVVLVGIEGTPGPEAVQRASDLAVGLAAAGPGAEERGRA
jgi:hydrogenase maturation protease